MVAWYYYFMFELHPAHDLSELVEIGVLAVVSKISGMDEHIAWLFDSYLLEYIQILMSIRYGQAFQFAATLFWFLHIFKVSL